MLPATDSRGPGSASDAGCFPPIRGLTSVPSHPARFLSPPLAPNEPLKPRAHLLRRSVSVTNLPLPPPPPYWSRSPSARRPPESRGGRSRAAGSLAPPPGRDPPLLVQPGATPLRVWEMSPVAASPDRVRVVGSSVLPWRSRRPWTAAPQTLAEAELGGSGLSGRPPCAGDSISRETSPKGAPRPLVRASTPGSWGCEGPGGSPGRGQWGAAEAHAGAAQMQTPHPRIAGLPGVSAASWRGRPAEVAYPHDLRGASRTPLARLRVTLRAQIPRFSRSLPPHLSPFFLSFPPTSAQDPARASVPADREPPLF